MRILHALLHALAIAGSMTWEVLWALILGFALSAIVQAVVRRETIIRLLGDDRPKTLAIATGLGAPSSSCSMQRSRSRGACFARAPASRPRWPLRSPRPIWSSSSASFLALLIGWQFTLAEFIGGPLMIVFIAVLLRLLLRERLVREAQAQAGRGLLGQMEGHAAMDMSVQGQGSIWQRLRLREGFTAVSHIFVMEWAAILRDTVGGLLIAGAFAAWVPASFGDRSLSSAIRC